MSSITREEVLAALAKVQDTESGTDVVSAGLVSGIVIRGHEIGFLLSVAPEKAKEKEPLRRACEAAVAKLHHVDKVTAVLTAERGETPAQAPGQKGPLWNPQKVEHVKHVLVVASGKGGVGKSTTTLCLAYALAEKGKRVGILDADIYGPSMPRMLGLSGQPDIENNKMLPLVRGNISCMSIGFLMADEAAILRGPMITKALQQMVRAVQWGTAEKPLDVLLIDLPPGTGDVQLSLAQQVATDGAVVVTTPQQVAVADARKAVQMFRKTGTPVFGVLENMSYLETGNTKLYPFGQGGGEGLAKEMSTLFLGQVPLQPELGAAVDKGDAPKLPSIYNEVAAQLLQQLKIKSEAA